MINWLRCFFGKHPAVVNAPGEAYPELDLFWCLRCKRLLHVVERGTGLRYRSLYHFIQERTRG